MQGTELSREDRLAHGFCRQWYMENECREQKEGLLSNVCFKQMYKAPSSDLRLQLE